MEDVFFDESIFDEYGDPFSSYDSHSKTETVDIWNDVRDMLNDSYVEFEDIYDREIFYDPAEYPETADDINIPEDVVSVTFDFPSYRRRLLIELSENYDYYRLIFRPVTGYCVNSDGLKYIYDRNPLLILALSKHYGDIRIENGRELSEFRFDMLINELVCEHKIVRNIILWILRRLGENKHIFWDIARCIENDHLCMIDESFDRIAKYYDHNSLIRGITGSQLKVNFNRRNLNCAYILAVVANDVQEQDLGKLINVSDDLLRDVSGCDRDSLAEDFIIRYYMEKIIGEFDYDTYQILDNYAEICSIHHIKFSLQFNSLKQISKFIDEVYCGLYDDEPLELMPDDSRFENLRQNLPEGFEFISTRDRLYEEGVSQSNCVFSYINRIRDDEVAILHWERNDNRYTIEVRTDENGFYTIAQMKARFNFDPAKDDFAIASLLIGSIKIA